MTSLEDHHKSRGTYLLPPTFASFSDGGEGSEDAER